MGIIDPMMINQAVLAGGADFGGWVVAWWAIMALLVSSAGAIWLSVAPAAHASVGAQLRLGHAQLAAVGLARGR